MMKNQNLSMYLQQGVVSVTAAIFLGGMLTFFSLVLLVIVMSTTDSRLSMLADAVLYSASDSYSAQADAQKIHQANVTGKTLGLKGSSVSLQTDEGSAGVTVQGVVSSKELSLSQDLGQNNINISQQAQSKIHQTTLELAVMLDVSNSMKGKPMTQAIKGLRDFADILYAEERRNYSKVISIIPATGYVNIGYRPAFFKQGAIAIPRGLRPLAKEQRWTDLLDIRVPGRWRGAMCSELTEVQDGITSTSGLNPNWIRSLELPPIQQDLSFHLATQAEPAIEKYENGMPLQSFYPSKNKKPYRNNWKHMLALFDSPDCGVSKVLPYLSNHQDFVKGLKTLYPEFNTNNAEGVMWAWRLLSPKWRGQWDKKKSELPRDHGQETNRKAMILFTDGDHLMSPRIRDKKQVAICREMKKQGIEIFAIDFNNRSPVMQACASPGKYYQATNRTIRTVLKQVATTLTKIELVK